MSVEGVLEELARGDAKQCSAQVDISLAQERAEHLASAGDAQNPQVTAVQEAISLLFRGFQHDVTALQQGLLNEDLPRSSEAYKRALEGSRYFDDPHGPYSLSGEAAVTAALAHRVALEAGEAVKTAEQQLLGVLETVLGSVATHGRTIRNLLDNAIEESQATITASGLVAAAIRDGQPS